jgi:hypothetical protein
MEVAVLDGSLSSMNTARAASAAIAAPTQVLSSTSSTTTATTSSLIAPKTSHSAVLDSAAAAASPPQGKYLWQVAAQRAQAAIAKTMPDVVKAASDARS